MNKIFSVVLLCAALVLASCSKNEDTISVSGVTLNETTLTLTVGDEATLVATIDPDDADEQGIIWASSDATVATVSPMGEVTAVKEGEATITATSVADETLKAACAVTVTKKEKTLTWAKGNLIADGANGAKNGTATDKGLYFQFGSLIGWSETGDLAITVKPAAFNGKEGWAETGKIWQGTEGTVPFTATGSDDEKAGVGDPCRYYLKGTWRLPTKDEYVALFKDGGYPSGTWKWENASATNSTKNLTFAASGYRINFDSSLDSVGAYGFCWSASPSNASTGYSLRFGRASVDPDNLYYRTGGLPVRCVQESN